MFNLVIIRPDGKEVEESFTGHQTIVGRHEKCDLRLVDSMVSRNHCLILSEGKRFVVKDLESRNGTWVNGRRIKNRRHIKVGDVIQIGPFRLLFRKLGSLDVSPGLAQTQTVDLTHLDQEPFVHKHETERIVKPLGMISSYLSEATEHCERVPTRVRRERLNRNLLTLYRITEELVVTKDLDEILDYVMDQIFDIFTPSQATILLRDGEEEPVPKRSEPRQKKGTSDPSALPS